MPVTALLAFAHIANESLQDMDGDGDVGSLDRFERRMADSFFRSARRSSRSEQESIPAPRIASFSLPMLQLGSSTAVVDLLRMSVSPFWGKKPYC